MTVREWWGCSTRSPNTSVPASGSGSRRARSFPPHPLAYITRARLRWSSGSGGDAQRGVRTRASLASGSARGVCVVPPHTLAHARGSDGAQGVVGMLNAESRIRASLRRGLLEACAWFHPTACSRARLRWSSGSGGDAQRGVPNASVPASGSARGVRVVPPHRSLTLTAPNGVAHPELRVGWFARYHRPSCGTHLMRRGRGNLCVRMCWIFTTSTRHTSCWPAVKARTWGKSPRSREYSFPMASVSLPRPFSESWGKRRQFTNCSKQLSLLKVEEQSRIVELSGELRRLIEGVAIPAAIREEVVRHLNRLGKDPRLRGAIQRDCRGFANRLLCGPAGHVSERHGGGGDPRAHQQVLGIVVHRQGRSPIAFRTASTIAECCWPWGFKR